MSSCIDWHEQWELHAPNFRDGFAHIDLGSDRQLILAPGPGFGDFSHATTRLMLEYLKSSQLNRTFVDIGSGSGILSLAASALGVEDVYGIEIEEEAILHSAENAKLNSLNVNFCLPSQFMVKVEGPVTIAMNMIRSEQQAAWASLKTLHGISADIFTSGVLKEEREQYLEFARKNGWNLISSRSSKSWLAFHFTI